MPELKPGELLVRVHAASINPPDWYLCDGFTTLPADWRPPVPLPAIPGSDVSGIVEAVGNGMQNFSVGDAVFGMIRFPSFGESAAYAEYVAAPASDFAHKPASIAHATAAAAPMALLTTWQFLIEFVHEHANPFQSMPHHPVPLEGRRILVNGAAGGVGHLALQLAKSKGAHVIVVASDAHRFMAYSKYFQEEIMGDKNDPPVEAGNYRHRTDRPFAYTNRRCGALESERQSQATKAISRMVYDFVIDLDENCP
jgi:NADPH:quinone reductase-like Zn-dependent oxidoreductase